MVPEVNHCIIACIRQKPFYPEMTGVIISCILFSLQFMMSQCQGEPERVIPPDQFNSREILRLCNIQTALLFGCDKFLLLLVICISLRHLRIEWNLKQKRLLPVIIWHCYAMEVLLHCSLLLYFYRSVNTVVEVGYIIICVIISVATVQNVSQWQVGRLL